MDVDYLVALKRERDVLENVSRYANGTYDGFSLSLNVTPFLKSSPFMTPFPETVKISSELQDEIKSLIIRRKEEIDRILDSVVITKKFED